MKRGFEEDHSTIQRWVVLYSPAFDNTFHKKMTCPGNRWRLNETYFKIKGQWKYFYLAVDTQGDTIDFLLTAKRHKQAALRFLTKAIARNGKPGLINIDKSGAKTAAIKSYKC